MCQQENLEAAFFQAEITSACWGTALPAAFCLPICAHFGKNSEQQGSREFPRNKAVLLQTQEQCQPKALDSLSQLWEDLGSLLKSTLTSPDHRTSSELTHPQLLGLLCTVIYCSPSVIAFLELLMADISDAIKPEITCEMKSGFSCWDMYCPRCLSVSI